MFNNSYVNQKYTNDEIRYMSERHRFHVLQESNKPGEESFEGGISPTCNLIRARYQTPPDYLTNIYKCFSFKFRTTSLIAILCPPTILEVLKSNLNLKRRELRREVRIGRDPWGKAKRKHLSAMPKPRNLP